MSNLIIIRSNNIFYYVKFNYNYNYNYNLILFIFYFYNFILKNL